MLTATVVKYSSKSVQISWGRFLLLSDWIQSTYKLFSHTHTWQPNHTYILLDFVLFLSHTFLFRQHYYWRSLSFLPRCRLTCVGFTQCLPARIVPHGSAAVISGVLGYVVGLVGPEISKKHIAHPSTGTTIHIQGYHKWLSSFQQLVIHNTLDIWVYVFVI